MKSEKEIIETTGRLLATKLSDETALDIVRKAMMKTAIYCLDWVTSSLEPRFLLQEKIDDLAHTVAWMIHDKYGIHLHDLGSELPNEQKKSTVSPAQKPPLGIKPRKFHNEERLEEIVSAVQRYIGVQANIPYEWMEEFLYLLDAQKIEHGKSANKMSEGQQHEPTSR